MPPTRERLGRGAHIRSVSFHELNKSIYRFRNCVSTCLWGLSIYFTVPQTGQGCNQASKLSPPVLREVALYGGGLTLGTAPLGGLRAELVLPAV